LVGKANFNVSAGAFLNHAKTTIIDFKHFQGNQTIFGSHYNDGFQLLPIILTAQTIHGPKDIMSITSWIRLQ